MYGNLNLQYVRFSNHLATSRQRAALSFPFAVTHLVSDTWQGRCFGAGGSSTFGCTPCCAPTCPRGCTAPPTSCPPAGLTPWEKAPTAGQTRERVLPTSLCTSATSRSTSTPWATRGRLVDPLLLVARSRSGREACARVYRAPSLSAAGEKKAVCQRSPSRVLVLVEARARGLGVRKYVPVVVEDVFSPSDAKRKTIPACTVARVLKPVLGRKRQN